MTNSADTLSTRQKLFPNLRPKHLAITAVAGVLLGGAIAFAFHLWLNRDGYCVDFYSDGRREIQYGADCDEIFFREL